MYQYKDHLGNVRLSYADCDGNGVINPATEILEENNYYPFGLQHKGYNEIANSCRSEEAEKYKFLNKEYESSFGLNVTETDFRQYDSAIGRFTVMDMLSELAPNQTPYRYGFNNPVFFSDPSELFETYSQAMSFLQENGFDGRISWFDKNDPSKGFVVTVVGGEFDGKQFYNFVMHETLSELLISGSVNRSGGGFNLNGLGNFGLDKQIQHHLYTTANLYQYHRDEMRTRQWDDFQRGLDYIGMAPGIGEPIDLINAGISAIRGNYVDAGFGLGAMIPFAGNFVVGAKHLNRISKYEKLADGFGTRAYIKEFNNTTTINTRILFNDITQGGTKKIIKTPQGNIINATMSDGSIIQLRNFSTKSGSINHSTIQFIGTQNKWKFNY